MSGNVPDEMQRPWRRKLAELEASRIDPAARESTVREYKYTHGFEPEDGTWLIPSGWHPLTAVVMGRIYAVEYISRKSFEGPKRFIFHHDHAIDHRPWLAGGRNKYGEVTYLVVGGGYTVTAHGIEDDDTDVRDLPPSPAFRVPRKLPSEVVGMGKMHSFLYGFGGEKTRLDLSQAQMVLGYTRGRKSRLYICPER